MSQQVIIDSRFHGPPSSANGGYVCGIVAGLIGSTAEVTLLHPPPVGRPLEITRLEGGGVILRDGAMVLAEGVPASVEIDVPVPVSFREAEQAAKSYVWFDGHPFPTCFVCGPDRSEGDGLRIFPGPVAGRNIIAAPWTPHASLADEGGTVRPEIVWAALDCPSGIVFAGPGMVVVLGRLAARLIAPIVIGQRYVVIGWQLGVEGRKLHSGSALFSENGTLHAVGKATWISIVGH